MATPDAQVSATEVASASISPYYTANSSPTHSKNDINPPKYVDVTLGPQHFDLVCVIGEGAFGKVLLVKPRLESTSKLYAMKVISKKLLRKKNHFSYMQSERDLMVSCIIYHELVFFASLVIRLFALL